MCDCAEICELCDQMRVLINYVGLHHHTISEALFYYYNTNNNTSNLIGLIIYSD